MPARAARLAPLAAALLLGLLAPARAADGVLEGRVVRVLDGDTVEVLVDERPVRVRLAGIDSPERGQPWSRRAREALSRRVFGRAVRVIQVATDRYGRTVGELYADDVCVGCELVREGHAWVYRGFSEDRVLFALEAEARAAGRGLWGLPEAQRVPPWQWRHGGAPEEGGSRAPVTPASEPGCGSKRTCGEMSSCAEARFHLERCGLGRLDGDGDGVPCESLCGG